MVDIVAVRVCGRPVQSEPVWPQVSVTIPKWGLVVLLPAALPSLYSIADSPINPFTPQVGLPTKGRYAGCSVQTTSLFAHWMTEKTFSTMWTLP